MDDFVSLDGTMYRVRSCTERHGVWLEQFHPQRKDGDDKDEPDNYIFVSGDIVAQIGRAMTECELDVDRDDDSEFAAEVERG